MILSFISCEWLHVSLVNYLMFDFDLMIDNIKVALDVSDWYTMRLDILLH